MDIQHLVIADHHINLIRALKDYRHYIWEIAKVVIPVVLGLLTVVVMRGNDSRNKKRWLNEGYLKRKIELEIEIRQILLNIKRQLDNLPDTKTLKEIKNSLNETYLQELNEINKTFLKLKKEFKKDDYAVEHLLDEYLVFVKKRNVFDEYKKSHQDFLTEEAYENTEIPISQEDVESDGYVKIESLIDTIYSFKEQTEKIIRIIENNFKISNRH